MERSESELQRGSAGRNTFLGAEAWNAHNPITVLHSGLANRPIFDCSNKEGCKELVVTKGGKSAAEGFVGQNLQGNV